MVQGVSHWQTSLFPSCVWSRALPGVCWAKELLEEAGVVDEGLMLEVALPRWEFRPAFTSQPGCLGW